MIYYKLGADKIKVYYAEGSRAWAEYGVRHPALRKIIVFAGIIITLFVILGGLAPSVGYDTKAAIASSNQYVNSLIGDKATDVKST